MAGYVPCDGSGKNAVDLVRYPGQRPVGVLDSGSPAKTFGKCPACPRTVMAYGLPAFIKVTRHKPQQADT